jgi:Cytochrome P450
VSYLTLRHLNDVNTLRGPHAVRACLNETLRLFPSVDINIRASVRASVLPGSPGSKSIYVPENVTVLYSNMLVHRRKDLWGEDALEFNPERWIDPERLKIITSNPFKFAPFGAGPRNCPGQVGYHLHHVGDLLILIPSRPSRTMRLVSVSEIFPWGPPISRLVLTGDRNSDGQAAPGIRPL